MPKSLHGWLHYSALKWMMPGEAVQEDHGGMWHKLSDSAWTECGRWVAGANRRAGAGFGPSRFSLRSPWWGRGSLAVANLCPKCFAVELPILAYLERVVVHGGQPMGDGELATRCVSHGGSLFSGDSGVCEAVEGRLAPWMDEEFLAECEAETVWVMPATPVTVKSRVSHNSDYATTPQEEESEPE